MTNSYFLPGKWVDNVDVNDFVNLNKKPLYEKVTFLISPDFFKPFINSLNNYISLNEATHLPQEKLLSLSFIFEELERLSFEEISFSFSNTSSKRFNDLFEETAASDLRKAIKMELLEKNFGYQIPPIFTPDIRQLPLYGTKRLINDKKNQLKKLEKFLKTSDWMEKRIEINRQIESLETFEATFPFPMQKAAQHSTEALNGLLSAVIFAIKENPYVTFHLPSLIHFIDIYIENDIYAGRIKEAQAQLLIAEFYTKLLFIHHFFAKKQIKFLVLETIFSAEPSKSTYRFLHFYSHLEHLHFPLMVVPHSETPEDLQTFYNQLMKEKKPIRFLHSRLFKDNQFYAISHLGFPYRADQDVILFNKPCDSMKLLYLTLNGGKDTNTNSNIYPIRNQFKDDVFDFEDFKAAFEQVVSYVFTVYSEANNLIMHLSEKYFSLPFRNSFKGHIWLYKYFFSFTQIDALAIHMLALKHNTCSIQRNQKGFVTNIHPLEKFNDDEISDMIGELALLFQEQMERVLFYKDGKANLHFFLNEPLTSVSKYKYFLPPPEFLSAHFILHNKARFQNYQQILKISGSDVLDIAF